MTPSCVFALLKSGVLMELGLIIVTRTGEPSRCSSTRSESIQPFNACFDAQYAACSGTPRSDSVLPTQISVPCVLSRCGNATIAPCTCPMKFTSMMRRTSARASSRAGAYALTAALFTHVSMRP